MSTHISTCHRHTDTLKITPEIILSLVSCQRHKHVYFSLLFFVCFIISHCGRHNLICIRSEEPRHTLSLNKSELEERKFARYKSKVAACPSRPKSKLIISQQKKSKEKGLTLFFHRLPDEKIEKRKNSLRSRQNLNIHPSSLSYR